MDSFELNKIIAAVLMVVFIVFGISKFSDLIFDVLYKYEKEHILLETTKLEALNELVDYKRLSNFLKKIQNNIIHKKLKYISPMAVPLILEFNTEKIEKNHLIKYELDNTEDNILREADLKNENLV